MTPCPDANQLAELVDGTLADTGRAALEHHLDACLACSALVGELAWVVAPGQTARAWRATAPRTQAEILAVWRTAIAQVAARHGAGDVVGALSPDRIAIGDDGQIAIASSAAPVACCTAPEQLHGAPASRASDQFALCASLWEALAGRPAFRGATNGALAVAMLIPPAPPAAAERRVFAVLARGLAADPDRRWPDLVALLAALDRSARRMPRRPRARIAALIAALIALGAAVIAALVVAAR
jgi:hypothetical protein